MIDFDKLNLKLIYQAYDILLRASDKSAIQRVLEECVNHYDLSKAAFFQLVGENHEIRVSYLQEKNRSMELKDKSFILKDYDDGTGEFVYSRDDGLVICEDVEKKSNGKIFDEVARVSGAKAYLGCHVFTKLTYLGTLLFMDCEKSRDWDEGVIETLKKLSDILCSFLLRRNYEELQEKLSKDFKTMAEEAKGIKDKFLSNMSHEIRNPLNAIIGMTTIMRHNPEDYSTLSQCIDKVDQASKQLLKLVNSCTDITLFDDSSSLLNNVWFTFEDIENEIYRNNTHLTKGHNHSFSIEYPHDRQVCGDKEKLVSILNSLLHNCYRFTPSGGSVSVKIVGKEIQNRRNIYTFTVEDNGVGIDEKFIPILFDPFSKEITSQTAQDEGSGLGLALTKHLVDLMQGEISVKSKKGEGTTVIFDIPLEEDGEEAYYETDNEDYEFTETYVGRRVLIAEDNSLMAEILMMLLGYKGLETDWASNGNEVLEKFVNHEAFYYDIVLMDLLMPGMDGYEAAKQIRSSDKADASMIPIIALSAETMDDAVEKAISSGMNYHLKKPVGEKELLSVISRFVL